MNHELKKLVRFASCNNCRNNIQFTVDLIYTKQFNARIILTFIKKKILIEKSSMTFYRKTKNLSLYYFKCQLHIY